MKWLESPEKPIIIAHRGSAAWAPENTLAAFQLAVEQGSDAIELDTRLTSDSQVVVIHDTSLRRTTGINRKVRQMGLEGIKKLDAGVHFSPAHRNERIPLLDEVIELVGDRSMLNIELATYGIFKDELPEKVAGIIRRHQCQDNVIFSSFDPRKLLKISSLLSGALCALITLPGWLGALMRGRLFRAVSPALIHPHYHDVTAGFLEDAHIAGRRVNAWTVNDPEDMRNLYNLGIDGIITDDPPAALKVRETK